MVVSSLKGIQRTVLFEDFTATWCPPCGTAAPYLEQLKNEVGDSLVIAGIHAEGGDPFYQYKCYTRYSYYGVQCIPTVYADGVLHYTGSSNAYYYYRNMFNQRKTIDQPLTFTCSGEFYPNTKQGTLNLTIHNVGNSTITGYLRIYMILIDTPYSWQGQSHLYWVTRDMLPNQTGTYYSLAPGSSIDHSENFTVPSSDNEHKIAFIVFFQNDNTKEVIGARPEFELDSLTWIYVEENPKEDAKTPSICVKNEGKYVKFILKNLKNANLKIFDITGREILSQKISDGEFNLKLEKGVYFYRVNNIEGKLVVAR